jgi:hypothetical protein
MGRDLVDDPNGRRVGSMTSRPPRSYWTRTCPGEVDLVDLVALVGKSL